MELIINIPEKLVTDIKDYCGMSMTDAKKALPTILNAIHNGISLDKIKDKIKNEIQCVYNDNKECDQEDVAYGLEIAMDIIEECR